MRYSEISETPIDQYKALGDWDNAKGSFIRSNGFDQKRDFAPREISQNIIHSEKSVQKIKDLWTRVPQKFNFFIINVAHGINGYRFNPTISTIDEFQNNAESLTPYLPELTLAHNAINVIYTSNFTNTNNYMPMTAWIMAHRLSHIFQIYRENNLYNSIQTKLNNAIIATGKAYGINVTVIPETGIVAVTQYSGLIDIIAKILTMRSARNNRLTSPFDYIGELLAQYLIGGKITFNSVPNEVKFQPTNNNYKTIMISQTHKSLIDSMWTSLAGEFENDFNHLLDSLIGKVLVL